MYSVPSRFAGIASGKAIAPPQPVTNPATPALPLCQVISVATASSVVA